MSRRLGLAAWVGATVVSVAVSTAAVDSVRAQVTERPAVVSLATLRRATSTTTTPPAALQPSRPPSSTTSTTAALTPSTTRASVAATPATTVETTPPRPTSPPPSAPPSPNDPGNDNADTVTETRTFRGGRVTVSYDGESLELVEAIPEDGFELAVEQQPDRIVVRFVAEGRSSGLLAQVTRDALQIRVFD